MSQVGTKEALDLAAFERKRQEERMAGLSDDAEDGHIDIEALNATMAAAGHAIPADAPATAGKKKGGDLAEPKGTQAKSTNGSDPKSNEAKGTEAVRSDTSRGPMSASGKPVTLRRTRKTAYY
jgi:hypothetical protein